MTKACRSFSTDPYLEGPIWKPENPFDNARTPFTKWVQRSAVPTFRSMTAWSSLRIPCSLRGVKRFEHDVSNRFRVSSAHGLDFSIRSLPPPGSHFPQTFLHFISKYRFFSHFESNRHFDKQPPVHSAIRLPRPPPFDSSKNPSFPHSSRN